MTEDEDKEAVADDGGNTITLSKPIQAHGEKVTKLTLREPTGDDVIACGHPMTFQQVAGETVMQVNAKAAAKYVSTLAGIPMSSVRAMSGKDLTTCINMVMGFFGDSIQE